MAHKLKDLQKAQNNLAEFSKQFMAVMTLTDKKGMWTCRCTRKNVQIFLVTGDTLFDCIVNASEKVYEKRAQLGV